MGVGGLVGGPVGGGWCMRLVAHHVEHMGGLVAATHATLLTISHLKTDFNLSSHLDRCNSHSALFTLADQLKLNITSVYR